MTTTIDRQSSCGHESNYGIKSTSVHHPELEHLATTMPNITIESSSSSSTSRSQSRMSISHAKGLLNMPGQNNCFLNSAVQVLWHLDIFRRSFREIHGHACMGEACIFCPLKELFNQFQHSAESALPSDALRLALAEAFSDQRRFQLGFMDDAAECFENILLRIHYHLTNKETTDCPSQCLSHCISHQKFAMNLYEQITCHSCGASSQPLAFSQMVHYTSTTALCAQSKLAKSNTGVRLNFGGLLKVVNSMGDIRNCPKMCGEQINIKKTLVNRPDVISVCLVWDSEHPTLTMIRSMFHLIETSIRLHEVFDLNITAQPYMECELQLVGLVTYYGKHYSTYLYNTKQCEWIYFDDATVRVIGPHWQQVVEKCLKGNFVPLLMLYANPNGNVVNTQNALQSTIPMTVIKKSKNNKMPINCINNETNRIWAESRLHKTSTNSSVKSENFTDVPDSPSATSTCSYFSDVADYTDGYINRKTVETILKIQQNNSTSCNKEHNIITSSQTPSLDRKQNRNSYSSLESFDSTMRSSLVRNVCSLQRRDSGNSSGDRSSSVSSVDTPYYPHKSLIKTNYHKKSNNKHNSDQGYDSFSLSSSDSYPCTASSPSKMNSQKLKQIPEDVHSIELNNSIEMSQCNQLRIEVEVLMQKSREKEQEGDLRAAVALSDSAAAKARVAMDAPYSSHQALICAKMQHSICVMRSTCLHKRVLEMEAEEKRLLKAAQEYHHCRQSSRDSNHGSRHSRQNSRDGKEPKALPPPPKEQLYAKQPLVVPKGHNGVEVYATLPKKTKKNSALWQSSNSSLTNEVSCKISKESTILLLNTEKKKHSNTSTSLKEKNKESTFRESDFSDYYSEWEGLQKKLSASQVGHTSTPGWQSCRENDSESYGELGSAKPVAIRKQCKVKRKLLLGGLLKSKNRSMPDLRENELKDNNKVDSKVCIVNNEDNNCGRTSVANIRTKGFHQSHRSFVAEQGFYSKPALVKVNPPAIVGQSTPVITKQQQVESTNNQKIVDEKHTNSILTGESCFYQELQKKRTEILKCNKPIHTPISVECSNNNVVNNAPKGGPILNGRKPTSHEIASFISKNAAIPFKTKDNEIGKFKVGELTQRFDQMNVRCNNESKIVTIHAPIPIHPSASGEPLYSGLCRTNRPPDYRTTIKRLEMNLQDRAGMSFPVPVPPPSVSPNVYASKHLEPSMSPTCKAVPLIPVSCDQAPVGRIIAPSSNRTVATTNGTSSSQLATNELSKSKMQSTSTTCYTSPNAQKSLTTTNHLKRRTMTTTKKSVKFSDNIELVACGDDHIEDEYLPNPLLEKVLNNKKVVYTLPPQ